MNDASFQIGKPPVFVRNGAVFTDSRDVALVFRKRHDNVLRDIAAMITDAPACALNFEETSGGVAMPRGGSRQVRSYRMTRDGFALLAMGFAGSRIPEWWRSRQRP